MSESPVHADSTQPMSMSEIVDEEQKKNVLESRRVQKLQDIRQAELTIDNVMNAMRQTFINYCDNLKEGANIHRNNEYCKPFCEALDSWIAAIRLSGEAIRIGGEQDLDQIKDLVEQATGSIWQGISHAGELKAKEMVAHVNELQDINQELGLVDKEGKPT